MSFFFSAIILFIISCCNFYLDFLCLVNSGASFGVGSFIEILSKFFIKNNLLLMLLRTFSHALKIILSYLKNKFFQLFL